MLEHITNVAIHKQHGYASNKAMLFLVAKLEEILGCITKLTLVLSCEVRVDTFCWADSSSLLNLRICEKYKK